MFMGLAKQLYRWCIVSQSVIWYCVYLNFFFFFFTTGELWLKLHNTNTTILVCICIQLLCVLEVCCTILLNVIILVCNIELYCVPQIFLRSSFFVSKTYQITILATRTENHLSVIIILVGQMGDACCGEKLLLHCLHICLRSGLGSQLVAVSESVSDSHV